jgi:hypothetical protein
MNFASPSRELLQGPIIPRLGIMSSSRPRTFVLLPVQPDKQRLFRSIFQPYREPQKPKFLMSRTTDKKYSTVPFSEQILVLADESKNLLETPVPVPPGVRERVLPRLRCLQLVLERCPKRVVICEGYSTTYYVEKLVCGHELITYPQAHSLTARRRNCVECVRLQSSLHPGAPVVSVAGGTAEGASRSVAVPPFELPEKKPSGSVHSATETEVITRESQLG